MTALLPYLHWLILAALAAGGVLVLIGMLRELRRGSRGNDPESMPLYRIPLLILIAVCAYLLVTDDRAAIDASIAREQSMILSFSTRECPPRRPGDADALIFTVHGYADGRPEDRRVSCARIPQRVYEFRHPRIARAPNQGGKP